ncbi:MAG: NAD(P)-dependent oxidoreductase [Bacteroidota bacterium]
MPDQADLLIIDRFQNDFLQRLQALEHYNVRYYPDVAPDRVDELLEQAEVLLLRSKVPLDTARLAKALQLKAVIRAGAGLEEIDHATLEARGIPLLSCAGANANSVGEFALGLLIGLMHHQNRANREVQDYHWEREANRGYELTQRTVGIIGYGHTGRAFARKLLGFDCRILAYDPYNPPKHDDLATGASLEQIQSEAEVLSFHVPLTDETRGYYSADFQQNMQKQHWLLNCARGEVVDLDAVLDGLSAGKLKGAGIDVLPNENIAKLEGAARERYERLAHHPDIILTPHIAGRTFESEDEINRMVMAHLAYLETHVLEKASA